MTYYLSSRRVFIVFGFIICVLLAVPSFAQSSRQVARAQAIANHFSEIKTMTGDFIQFSPKGKMSEGTFYLERPGRIRFGYKGVPLQIIADGKMVGVNNRALNTWNLYQLSQTPMKFLLDDKINISSKNLLALREDPGVITIVLHDKSIGKGQIRMIFDSKDYSLRQWTIVDQQNLETTVQIMNVRTGIRFVDGMFTIPYKNIAISRNRNGN
ncbi:LolA family protein [Bartonella schoenbuchensis]|nr:outer membrane lipoprotein carrier protein LolA [Bartonella schoenbuchensis]AQX31421.1 Outer membrane lipoprotein-sorting protein [Bartonella schoenbuchensis R1]CDP79358.1 outer membrane lipoprotein carrier protein, LolA family [Bartonella schoenbuchensis]CDP79513.1 outer membrane lipoprotein carrier protein, LolA family [Bartonella schoenbuchensis]